MRPDHPLPASYFESKYRTNIDPWCFRTSPYEREKYLATVNALTQPIYNRALEIGCSIGVLTSLLAPRCRNIVALDGSATAIGEASKHRPANVSFLTATVPAQFPDDSFDLIVLSEILYYLSPADLELLAQKCIASLASTGVIVACHWLGETDYPLPGAQASDLFAGTIARRLVTREVLCEDVYRLERFSSANSDANT